MAVAAARQLKSGGVSAAPNKPLKSGAPVGVAYGRRATIRFRKFKRGL